jgi:hypothetical protein
MSERLKEIDIQAPFPGELRSLHEGIARQQNLDGGPGARIGLPQRTCEMVAAKLTAGTGGNRLSGEQPFDSQSRQNLDAAHGVFPRRETQNPCFTQYAKQEFAASRHDQRIKLMQVMRNLQGRQ